MLNESAPVMSAVKTYYFACTIFSFSIRIRNYQTIKFTDHCLIILNFSEILLSLLTSEMISSKSKYQIPFLSLTICRDVVRTLPNIHYEGFL